ncbi:MAG: PIN domain-containing protein [Verrucomicrobia bacterium]|nr:PIN domain-containing protein [Verrucomicrobiota bacterium]
MRAEALIDTNILLYAISKLPQEAAKTRTAIEILRTVDFGLSAQVLQEFYVVATGKMARRIEPGTAVEFLNLLLNYPVVPIDADLVLAAIKIQNACRISYWDAAILAAAENLEAPVVYSEDLSHMQFYGTTQVINPFLIRPGQS